MMKRFKKKSQGLVETGLFGVVVLIAFGMLVIFIQKMNGEQYTLMENFRRSLKKSHDDNQIVSLALFDDSRQADVAKPVRGEKIMRSASAQVHWAVPQVGGYTTEEQLEESPELMSWVSDDEGGGYWYEHQGVVQRTDENNDPQREYVYRIHDQEDTLSLNDDVRGVTRAYSSDIEENFGLVEDSGSISSVRTVDINTDMNYILEGSHTLSRSRSESDSRNFEVSK